MKCTSGQVVWRWLSVGCRESWNILGGLHTFRALLFRRHRSAGTSEGNPKGRSQPDTGMLAEGSMHGVSM